MVHLTKLRNNPFLVVSGGWIPRLSSNSSRYGRKLWPLFRFSHSFWWCGLCLPTIDVRDKFVRTRTSMGASKMGPIIIDIIKKTYYVCAHLLGMIITTMDQFICVSFIALHVLWIIDELTQYLKVFFLMLPRMYSSCRTNTKKVIKKQLLFGIRIYWVWISVVFIPNVLHTYVLRLIEIRTSLMI